MGFVELALIAIGLSMDAFAVSVCKGLGMSKLNWKHALVIALFFGAFQGIMPVIGWALGTQFEGYITSIDHWIAFVLLAFIGAKMLWDAFHEDDECVECAEGEQARLDVKELVMLAVATSIDALAVGITFAFLRVDIVWAALTIAVTTFVLSFIGVATGNQFGSRFRKPATIAGGIVLILIGLKILLEHLGFLG
ncbi:manganese efflux pump MntP family protein [Raoultibacter massiliensis]|uniref:Putative manganese efflux pump MntP n=1 Tax=Raoultibacter massiliensis TaxID=1852371 RepID=A0ABV1JDC0_9ACTN|nr:manganese efflux pump MntP family protein [Raoultibacter massiliensis]